MVRRRGLRGSCVRRAERFRVRHRDAPLHGHAVDVPAPRPHLRLRRLRRARRCLPDVRLLVRGREGRDHPVVAIGRAGLRRPIACDRRRQCSRATCVRCLVAARVRMSRAGRAACATGSGGASTARGRAALRADAARRARARGEVQRARSGCRGSGSAGRSGGIRRERCTRSTTRAGREKASTTIPNRSSARWSGSRSTPHTSSCITASTSAPWRSRARCSCAPSRNARDRSSMSGTGATSPRARSCPRDVPAPRPGRSGCRIRTRRDVRMCARRRSRRDRRTPGRHGSRRR